MEENTKAANIRLWGTSCASPNSPGTSTGLFHSMSVLDWGSGLVFVVPKRENCGVTKPDFGGLYGPYNSGSRVMLDRKSAVPAWHSQ